MASSPSWSGTFTDFRLVEWPIQNKKKDSTINQGFTDNYLDKQRMIDILIMILLCVNHFIINANHHSKSANITMNQTIAVLYFIFHVIWILIDCINSFTTLLLIESIVSIVSILGLMSSIVCVESRLDAYRLDREAAGWTEEKGYPEGYVHEYEKKDNK